MTKCNYESKKIIWLAWKQRTASCTQLWLISCDFLWIYCYSPVQRGLVVLSWRRHTCTRSRESLIFSAHKTTPNVSHSEINHEFIDDIYSSFHPIYFSSLFSSWPALFCVVEVAELPGLSSVSRYMKYSHRYEHMIMLNMSHPFLQCVFELKWFPVM